MSKSHNKAFGNIGPVCSDTYETSASDITKNIPQHLVFRLVRVQDTNCKNKEERSLPLKILCETIKIRCKFMSVNNMFNKDM